MEWRAAALGRGGGPRPSLPGDGVLASVGWSSWTGGGGGEPRLLHYGPEGLGLRLNSGPSSPGRLSLGQDCSAGLEESVAREALCPGQHSRYRLFSPGHLKARR